MSEILHILVVEDNPADVDLIRETLPDAGPVHFRIEALSRLSEALTRLKQEGIDLVLLDLGLPDSRGLDTFRHLRDAAPHLPVIILTGNSDQEVAVAAVKEGAQDYLIKGDVGGRALLLSVLYAVERTRAATAAATWNARMNTMLTSAPVMICSFKPYGEHEVTFVTENVNTYLGYRAHEIVAIPGFWTNHIHPEDAPRVLAERPLLMEKGHHTSEYRFQHKNGKYRWMYENLTVVRDKSQHPVEIVGACLDTTEGKEAQLRQSLWGELMGIVNEARPLVDTINAILAAIKQKMGFDAVGIRLRSGEDYPYFVHNGFSDDFLRTENTLAVHDPEGGLCRDNNGNISLECTCGLVLSGRTDPADPLFTPAGSFWTNDATPLLDLPVDRDPRLHPRNRCIHEGFRSIALIPVRAKGETVGLLQINDRQTDRLTPEMIRYFEGLGATIGIALTRRQAEEALHKSEAYFRAIIQNSSDIILIVDQRGIVTYASPSLERFLGYRPEEWIGKRSLDLIVAEDRSRAMKDFGEALQVKDVTVTNVFRARHKDGTERILEGIGKNLLDDPIVAGFVMNIRDITEAAETKEREEETNRRLKILFDSNPTGLILVNARTRIITSANAAALQIMGSSTEEAIGQVCHKFICPAEVYCCPILDKGQAADRSEKILIGKNNNQVPIIKTAVLVHIDNEAYLLESFIDDTERKEGQEQLRNTLESLRKAFGTIIQVMVAAVESRDPYTSGHQTRSADLARAIATEMRLPQEKIEAIRMAGTIHDIGKLSIPAEILSKPTRLTEIEFDLIKEHAHKGYEILKDVESPWPLADIVHQHHERIDGSGYPRNLKREDILIEARILSVADVVEAMASHRPYRPGLGMEAALDEIEKNRGRIYDDAAVDACLRLFREKGYQLART